MIPNGYQGKFRWSCFAFLTLLFISPIIARWQSLPQASGYTFLQSFNLFYRHFISLFKSIEDSGWIACYFFIGYFFGHFFARKHHAKSYWCDLCIFMPLCIATTNEMIACLSIFGCIAGLNWGFLIFRQAPENDW